MKKLLQNNPHTVATPISATLRDGTVVTGTLWLRPSRLGSFEVEHGGVRNGDGRFDHTSEAKIKMSARLMLVELAEIPLTITLVVS
jgi:hypothetical protein